MQVPRVWQDTNTFTEFLTTSFPSASNFWPVPEPLCIWSGGVYPCPHSHLRWVIYHGPDFLPQWSHSLIIRSHIMMSTSGKEVPDYFSKSGVPDEFSSKKRFIYHLDVKHTLRILAILCPMCLLLTLRVVVWAHDSYIMIRDLR